MGSKPLPVWSLRSLANGPDDALHDLIFSFSFFPLLPHHPQHASHCPLLQYVTCRLAQLTHIATGALTSFDVCMRLIMVTVLCVGTIYCMMTMTSLYCTERQGTIQMRTPTHKGSCGGLSQYVSFVLLAGFYYYFSILALKIVSLLFDICAKVWIFFCVLRYCAYLQNTLHTYTHISPQVAILPTFYDWTNFWNL